MSEDTSAVEGDAGEMSLQQELSKIQKNLVVPKKRYNSFGKYHYRNTEDIIDAVKAIMPDNATITLNDSVILIGDRYYVMAMAIFKIGRDFVTYKAYAREPNDKKGMDASQITGTASSYARKTALCGLFACDDGIDADTTNTGNGGSNTKTKTPASSDGTITIGKYKGKKLKDIGDKQLADYVKFLMKMEKPAPSVINFITEAKAYLLKGSK